MIAITEKLLQSAAGWQAFKEAKHLVGAGRVTEANYAPPLLKGLVRDQGKNFMAGLKINSATDMDNLCSCRESRVRGVICAHSVAVGLAMLGIKADGEATSTPVPKGRDDARLSTEERPKARITVEGSLNHLQANVEFAYSNPEARNAVFEVQLLNALTEAGFEQKREGLRLDGEKKILQFLTGGMEKLKPLAEIVKGGRIGRLTENFVRVEPKLAIRGAGMPGVFDANLSFVAGKEALFSASDLRQLLQGGKNHFALKSGKTAVVDEEAFADMEEVIRDCDPQQLGASYRIRTIQRKFLEASISRWGPEKGENPKAAIRTLGSLRPQLREYQVEGTSWMVALAEEGLGGILADEMGLGKTVQAIAMLEVLGAAKPSLVVCPSSLVENWRREIARFLPRFSVLVLEGSEREGKFGEISGHAVVLTSYALLRRDIEKYQDIDFQAVILDEAQHIKNPESQNAKAAGKFRAKTRFVLTGTPIENSIRDLWSLMEFALPGYLGGKKEFKERYEEPVLAGDRQTRERLGLRIAPFLLRRTKREVLTDLPDKIEQVVYCKLTNDQKESYFQFQNQARGHLLDAMAGNGGGATKMAVFTAILRLRQICCDLRLLGIQKEDLGVVSGKLQALREILEEARDGGHRTLVFSQFAEMLKLIRSQCEADGVDYCYLDGSTRNRMEQVDLFQNDATKSVFLISLKAGGVGLNLTAADTVVHFDPWWNPAVEAQATDRAHRIGQKNTVNILKLVAEGTIEERVLALQAQKQTLIGETLGSMESGTVGRNLETLRELLE